MRSDALRWCGVRCCVAAVALAATMLVVARPAAAQPGFGFNNRSVGGIAVDVNGLLQVADLDAVGQLQKLRAGALTAIPAPLGQQVADRKISLRGLQAKIRACREKGQELPDEVIFLAGLQRIRYVLVYPDKQDVVLVGPGEGWKIGPKGEAVGATTGRPVMLLDDLATALRAALDPQARMAEITCSIDPTAEGVAALRQHVARLKTIGNPQTTAAGIERVLGQQQITLSGVPGESHFARVLVAADYRMKRLAMGFEASPVRGLPSYLQMIPAGSRGMDDPQPRWWLTPNYRPLLRDADGLAWEIRGASVKAMTEQDFFTAAGQRQHTGQANPVAQQWADAMTARYDQLAAVEPIFGQLQNCIDLTIVAGLLTQQGLAAKAGLDLDVLAGGQSVPPMKFHVPKTVGSQASLMKKGSDWVIAVSGGVKINPRTLLEKAERSEKPMTIRDEAKLGEHADWWWN